MTYNKTLRLKTMTFQSNLGTSRTGMDVHDLVNEQSAASAAGFRPKKRSLVRPAASSSTSSSFLVTNHGRWRGAFMPEEMRQRCRA